MRRFSSGFFLSLLCLVFSNLAFAANADDINMVRRSLQAQAQSEKNLGHYDKAKKLLAIERNIGENITNGRKAYVIRTKVNEGKLDEAFQLSLGYEFPSKAAKIDYRQNKAVLKNCEKKWGDNYRMVKYCIEKQLKAKEAILAYPKDNIRKSCEKKWGDDFSMVEYCIKKQSEAKQAIYR